MTFFYQSYNELKEGTTVMKNLPCHSVNKVHFHLFHYTFSLLNIIYWKLYNPNQKSTMLSCKLKEMQVEYGYFFSLYVYETVIRQ